MKIFDKRDFVRFVRDNDELYISNVNVGSKEDSFKFDMNIVNDVVLSSGVYSLMFGCRGEVEFRKVNLVDELVEWNELDNDNEFKSLIGNWNENELDRDNVYFELVFDEEDFRCYFIIEDRFTKRSK